MLTVRVHREVGDLGALLPEWRELLASSPSATPFQSPEWVCAWTATFLGSKRLHVLTVWDGARLVGMMPMTLSRFPWRALRPVGAGVSDYLHPLSAYGWEEVVADALRKYFDRVSGVDLVDLQQIRESEPLSYRRQPAGIRDAQSLAEAGHYLTEPGCTLHHPGHPESSAGTPDSQVATDKPVSDSKVAERGQDARATGAYTVVRDEECFVLDLPETWDGYVATLSKSLRYEARRLDKPPYSTGQATVCTLTDVGEVKRGLDALFDLHARRWRKRGLPGVFAFRRVREFHYRFAEAAIKSGLLRLGVIEQNGQILGVIYAMAVNETVFFYQSGFDPDAKELSPGTVLVAHTIREAIARGAKHFDFLRGPEPYKLRWKPQHRTTNLRILIPRTVILGGVAHRLNRMRGAIEARIRLKLASKGQAGA